MAYSASTECARSSTDAPAPGMQSTSRPMDATYADNSSAEAAQSLSMIVMPRITAVPLLIGRPSSATLLRMVSSMCA